MKTFAILVGLSLLLPGVVYAHPGRTDSSGCHTCRTNCDSWGLSYGEYHCHNAKTIPVVENNFVPPVTETPVATKKPVVTITPTAPITQSPTETTTPSPTEATPSEPEKTPEVFSVTTESPTQTPTPKEETAGDMSFKPINFLATAGAIGLVVFALKKSREAKLKELNDRSRDKITS